MAIEFSVETGTASSTSTAYVTVAQFKQYWENRGTSFSEADSIIQGWINQATEYIDINYQFEGEVVDDDQALEWPRNYAVNKLGIYIDNDVVPTEVKNATCYLAAQAKTDDLNIVDDGVKSVSYGPVSKTYNKSSASKEYPAVVKILRNLLITGNQLMRVN
ncbi:MAG: hypothetical protein PHE51_04915 [Eubacteriales bacterium]|nr:hypothetical protein [Eubacteriales bacterium]